MLRCSREELIGMGAAAFSLRFRVSYPNGGMVPPGLFVSQRVFDEGGPLHYTAVLHPPGGNDVVISATAAGVRLEIGAPSVGSSASCTTSPTPIASIRCATSSSRRRRIRSRRRWPSSRRTCRRCSQPHRRRSAAVTASIARQCDRIDRLVQNLLVLTRARSRTLQLYPSEMELRPLIERISGERVWSYRARRAHGGGGLTVAARRPRNASRSRSGISSYEASRMSPAGYLPDAAGAPRRRRDRGGRSVISPCPGTIR